MTSVESGWEQASAGDKAMGIYVSRPAAPGRFPAVLVLQEIFGVNSYVRRMADRIAAEGYVAVAPDLFHRQGDRWEGRYDDFGPALERMQRFDDEVSLQDMDPLLDAVRGRADVRGERIAVLGFCLGGRLAYSMACTKDIQASAAFYGVGIPGPPLAKTGGLACPLLLFFAEKDQHAPVADAAVIEKALAAHGKKADIVICPGVDHGFFNDEREAFHPPTATAAWERLLSFLDRHLRGDTAMGAIG